GPVLEIRPAGIGRPGADEEEQARERGNDYLARFNCLPLGRDHLETAANIRFWMGPFCIWNRAIKSVAEGVGFEPTVGCPTLDFESSALNRTQPPFRKAAAEYGQERAFLQRTCP